MIVLPVANDEDFSQGTLFYLLNLAIEYRVWTWVPECLVGAYQYDTGSHPDPDEDEDVQR